MSIAQQLIADATSTVEAAGVLWRLRRVDSASIASMGIAQLAILPSPAEDAPLDAAAIIRRLTPEAAGKLAVQQDVILCAAIVAASTDGGETWEDLRFVLRPDREAAEQGILHVTRLPSAARTPIYAAAMALVTEEGAAVERLAAFRERA